MTQESYEKPEFGKVNTGKGQLPILPTKWEDLDPEQKDYVMRQSPDKPYLFLQDATEGMVREVPEMYKLVCPRRYVVPSGYPNPRLFSVLWATQLVFASMAKSEVNKTMVDCTLVAWSLVEHDMPLYFVGEEFIEALTQTEPPSEMLLSDLEWPFNGITFVLPEKFAMRYFKRRVMFISAARVPVGTRLPPDKVLKVLPNCRMFGIETNRDFGSTHGVFFHSSILFGDKPVDYASSMPDHTTVETVLNTKEFQNLMIDENYIAEAVTPEEDLALMRKVSSIGIWLLLAMMTDGSMIEGCSIARPAKVKHGHEKPELWAPRWIGRTYHYHHESLDGTHASPRLHWRKGHFRWQPYGPKRAQRRLIRIDPILIGKGDA